MKNNQKTKKTKRGRKTRKYLVNKSNLYGGSNGGSNVGSNVGSNDTNTLANNGLFGVIGNKALSLAGTAVGYIENKAAGVLGYKPKNVEADIDKNLLVEQSKEGLSNVSNVFSTTNNILKKGTATVIEGANSIINNNLVKESVAEAAGNTVDITKNLLKTVEEKLDNPALMEEVAVVSEKLGIQGAKVINALDEPINAAIDQTTKTASKLMSNLGKSGVNVGFGVASEIPVLGTFLIGAKIINDASKAVGSVVEAGSESLKIGSDIIKSVKEETYKLKELNEEKNNVINRVNESIGGFRNPLKTILRKGGTKRRHNNKTKRVKFVKLY